MKRKLLIGLSVFIVFFIGFLCLYPNLEFEKDGYLYLMGYGKYDYDSEDFYIVDGDYTCYDDGYSYSEERDISVKSWEYKGFLFFKYLKVEYIKGNKVLNIESILHNSSLDIVLSFLSFI